MKLLIEALRLSQLKRLPRACSAPIGRPAHRGHISTFLSWYTGGIFNTGRAVDPKQKAPPPPPASTGDQEPSTWIRTTSIENDDAANLHKPGTFRKMSDGSVLSPIDRPKSSDSVISIINQIGLGSNKKAYSFAYSSAGFPKDSPHLVSPTQKTVIPGSKEVFHSIGCGEDSYFCRSDALGIADGVGGWTGTTGW